QNMDPVAFVLESGNHNPQGVEAVTATGSQSAISKKVLKDGKLYLMYEGKMYDVRGARVQ
ncbi:MAG: hypothetical protein IKT19_02855, partial [Paludibacteraceae bacterium]|nr:hypothetical protein [Paludibacteraceae bacterium]